MYTMKFNKPYTPPILTVDGVFFQVTDDKLEVLLVQRSQDPFKGKWALPGGYNAAGQTTLEALESISKRKLNLSTNKLAYIEQLYTFDTIARDPRGHAVSVTYMGCGRNIKVEGGSEVAAFFQVDALPLLAYDHANIVSYARNRLASKLTYTNVAYSLLDDLFTLTQLQLVYEAVLGVKLDKRNFRKKFLSLDFIEETNETWRNGAHRPAKLYRFKDKTIQSLTRSFE